MYLTHTASKVADAFIQTLKDPQHPVLAARFPRLWVGVEYPAVEANYPGVWVTFDPDPTLRRAGVGHVEYVAQEDGLTRRGTRWRFSGSITATVVAMTRRERDELMDELLRSFAFAEEHPGTSSLGQAAADERVVSDLRSHLESDAFISVNVIFDEVSMSGMSSGSAPWDPEVLVWEGSLTTRMEGEFVSDLASQNVLVPIEAIVITPVPDLGPPPTSADDGWR